MSNANTTEPRGLLVEVMGRDCTNSGATSGKRKAILIGPGVPEIFNPSPDAPALYLIADTAPVGAAAGSLQLASTGWAEEMGLPRGRHCAEAHTVRVRAVPLGPDGPVLGGMAGGHYIHTSDGRFPTHAPIPVHDRIEGVTS